MIKSSINKLNSWIAIFSSHDSWFVFREEEKTPKHLNPLLNNSKEDELNE
jgi:hypothetical protein